MDDKINAEHVLTYYPLSVLCMQRDKKIRHVGNSWILVKVSK